MTTKNQSRSRKDRRISYLPRLEKVSCTLGRRARCKTSEGARASAELAPGLLLRRLGQRRRLETPSSRDRVPAFALLPPPPPRPPSPRRVPSPAPHGAGHDRPGAPRLAMPPPYHHRRRRHCWAVARSRSQRRHRARVFRPILPLRAGCRRAAQRARRVAVTEVFRTPPRWTIPVTKKCTGGGDSKRPAGGGASGRRPSMRCAHLPSSVKRKKSGARASTNHLPGEESCP